MTSMAEKDPLRASNALATGVTDVNLRDPGEPVSNDPDGEAQARERLNKLKTDYGATWDGPNDPDDPYNWPGYRKISIGIIFSLGQLLTLMSASMIAAALGDIERDVGIDLSTAQIVFSTYFLGLGFGPFLIAAWAEMGGRKHVWLFANAWYILWNAICPVGSSKALLIVGRLMAGFGASAGVTLTGPTMADMYRNEDRGKSLAIASFLPYLGPALGPIVGGLVAQWVDWPWIFWIMSIFNGVIMVVGLIFIRESYTPVLLRRKARLGGSGSSMSLPKLWSVLFWHDFFSRLSVHLARPLRLLAQRPIIQVLAVIIAVDFGTYTFLLSTFATLYVDRYGQSKSSSSLHYIAISIGCVAATQIGGRTLDVVYRRLRDRSPDRQGRPEFRVPWMVPGVVLTPVGLFWYGWAAQRSVSWIVVDIGAAINTAGGFIVSQALLAYLLDEFAEYAASASAASRLPSYIAGFAFPIFAPQLYERLGYGWGNSLLAFVWIVLIGPVPLALWLWGDKLRAMGRRDDESARRI